LIQLHHLVYKRTNWSIENMILLSLSIVRKNM
jgi:hypothetical protein